MFVGPRKRSVVFVLCVSLRGGGGGVCVGDSKPVPTAHRAFRQPTPIVHQGLLYKVLINSQRGFRQFTVCSTATVYLDSHRAVKKENALPW